MNWLAHIFISRNCIDYQLGNLLADPLKGRSWKGASLPVQDGFKMHARIDSFTDQNELVSRSKARLRARGYLKGIIVDIAYDHLLLKNWNQYSRTSLNCFINNFYKNAETAIQNYPASASSFVKRIIEANYLTSYETFDGLETVFQRFDQRLPQRILTRESTIDYLPALKNQINAIEQDFNQFFPQLIQHFRSTTETLPEEHWLK